MDLTFPTGCDTPAQRTEFCYLVQEKLRLLHNIIGKWYREGITKTAWNKLPSKVQNRYPYQAQLPLAEWQDFLIVFDNVEDKVVRALLNNRDQLKNSTNWTPNLNEVIEA